MRHRLINPWNWQDALGFSQAVESPLSGRILNCAGQASLNADGRPQFAGDMRSQLGLALDNLGTVLKSAGYEWSDVVVHLHLEPAGRLAK